ncbi:MAG: glutamate racemase [Clostridia bacterium]|nr:glutamate racemase [Clostridia bacterium]
MNKNGAIGFMDSGVGGLTVLAEAIKQMPDENFIYLGDSKNCPFGNKSAEELINLGGDMLRFLESKKVKCVMLACNTMSSLGEVLYRDFPFPVYRIITSVADSIEDKNLSAVGVIATEFTVRSGVYKEIINKSLPDCKVVAVGSKNLARLVEDGDLKSPLIKEEIKLSVDKILTEYPVKDIMLGCTHFPFVMDVFRSLYPDINFIDPAAAQCRYLSKMLKQEDMVNQNGGSLEIYTSGDINAFLNTANLLGIKQADKSATININEVQL